MTAFLLRANETTKMPDKTDENAKKYNKEDMEKMGFPRDAQGMSNKALPKGVQVSS